MRWPSSPGHGGPSSPGRSCWNFVQNTVRPLLFVTGGDGGVGPQASAMRVIVAQHRDLGIDGEAEMRVRGAQRTIHIAAYFAPRKDEPQIAGAFRQGDEQLIGLRRHADVVDAGHAARLLHAVRTTKYAAMRDRDHHHARGAILARPGGRRFPDCMSQQELLKWDWGFGTWDSNPESRIPNPTRFEPKGACAEAPNRT